MFRSPSGVLAASVVAACALVGASSAQAAVTFADPVTYATNGGEIWSMAVDDFDGDGRPDVLAPGMSPMSGELGSLSVLTSRGNGSLRPPVVSAGGAESSVVSGDFNGDGNADVATASVFWSGALLSLGDGAGGFAPATTVPGVDGVFAMAVADLNGDERLDLITAAEGGNQLHVLFGDGDGTFTDGPVLPLGDDTMVSAMAVGDFDGDGGHDLALVDGWLGKIDLLRDAGGGTFAAAGSFELYSPQAISVVDLDGDGKDDVLATSRWDDVLAPIMQTDGVFAPGATVPSGGEPYALSTADIDGDGKPDVTTANYGDGTYSFQRGLGGGAFAPPETVSLGPDDYYPHALATADFDGDGKLDIVVGDQSSRVSIVRNTSVPVAATGTTTLAFPDQPRNTIGAPLSVTVQNTGSAPLHVGAVRLSGTDGDDFLVGANDCTTPVPAAGSCRISVRFVPSVEAARTATLTVASDGGPLSVALTGTGTALPAGPTGPEGPGGPMGPVGPQGPAGTNGTNGTNGGDGSDGTNGAAGPAGAAGPSGPQGPAGPLGPQGPGGASGRAALTVVLAEARLRGTAKTRVRVAFGATLPGTAVLTVKRGRKTVATKRLTARGVGAASLKLPKLARGSYALQLVYTATDGQKKTATARLTVAKAPGR